MQTGIILSNLRVNKNITQSYIASLLGISLTTYKLYEQDARLMTLNEINFLSNFFEVSLDYLLGITNNPEAKVVNYNIDYKYLKFSLTFIRKRSRLSQATLAKKLNTSLYCLRKYENNTKEVSINYLYLFAKKFQISIDYICGKSFKKEIL